MSNVIDDLNYRGLIEQYSNEENVRKLLDSKQTIYCGFDPSAASMHLGNYVMISTLMRLQRAGHRIIAVVGGGTGMIGDPSGKSKERNLQNEDTLRANTECIRKQLERFLDLSDPEKGHYRQQLRLVRPYADLGFLRDYGKFFSVNYMLSKEIVASRLEAGISFTDSLIRFFNRSIS
jgi:tyrosyl-tRNA synthetase